VDEPVRLSFTLGEAMTDISGRQRRSRGLLGIMAATAVIAGMCVAAVPASATTAKASPPALPKVAATRGVGVLKTRVTRQARHPLSVPTRVSWPAAASAVIGLTQAAPPLTKVGARAAAANLTGSSSVPASGTGTPLWAQRLPGEFGGVQSVRMSVLPHRTAVTAGVRGVVFTVAAATGSPGGALRAGIDYAAFSQASGGNYGLGLGLVELPACALTTPSRPACDREIKLASVNDDAAQTVSAAVSVPASGAAVVLAATTAYSDGGGSAGTYNATSLKPSGTWSEGGSSGSFTYSYPITVPPAPSSLSPSLSLDYDSGSIDGQTAATQAQASWIGDGWTLSGGTSFIEQSFKPCQDDPEGSASPTATPDECYDGPVISWSQDGSSNPLVCPVPFSYTANSTCTASDDDGEVITHHVDSGNGTGSQFTDYWTITTRDGTTYYFGRNHLPGWASTDTATDSVDTVPVYSAHSGDPCYSSSGFSSSSCVMAYRWNLDYVTDVHGNAMAYYYDQASNAYAVDGATSSAVSYTRDSYLARIDYGLEATDAYTDAPAQVVFGTGDRCFSGTCDPLNTTNAANWQDVPYTQYYCAAAASCQVTYPTFWSTVRLATITTQTWNGSAYVPADVWTLGQDFPATGDGTSPALFLDSITHAGEDTTAGGSAVTLPSVTFSPVQLANRTNPGTYVPLVRNRIGSITTETGSVISVTYELTSACDPSSYPTSSANTSSCFPVYWQQFAPPDPDWFNKYAVQSVSVSDPTGGSPGTYTSYSYSGPAWHYDDNELVEAKYRTYGQWRGYQSVITYTGTGTDPQTENETTYYQGMSDDDDSTAVTLTDSQGGQHDDTDQLAGDVLEQTAYDGAGGPVDNSTIDSYWVSASVASRTRTGLPALTANVTGQVEEWTRQAITDTSTTTWRETETDTSFDATPGDTYFGLPLYTFAHGDLSQTSQQRCTTTTYAPANTTENLIGLVAETQVYAAACGGTNPDGASAPASSEINALTAPADLSLPSQLISGTRTYYDDPTSKTDWPEPSDSPWPQTTEPTTGNASVVQKANGYNSTGFTYQTTSATLYDSYGRPVTTFDGNGNTTVTTYTMTNGLTTSAEVTKGPTVGAEATNALTESTTTTYDPLRGIPLTVTDPNGVVTTMHYDGLGRLTDVWEYSRPTTDPASLIYTYDVPADRNAPVVVTTEKLNDESGYVTSTTLYDALLRVRQTQDPTPQGGILVTDDFYDSRGWEWKTNTDWWDSTASPGDTILTIADSQVPDQAETAYDGLGRPIMVTDYDDSVVERQTATAYYGDRVTTVPPQGGTPTSTVTDALGRTTELDSYTSRPTITTTTDSSGAITGVTITGGTYQATDYLYNTVGELSTTEDVSTGEEWTKTYNLLGQIIQTTDPDSGTTSMTYDDNGNLTSTTTDVSTTNPDGTTISYTYDALNRKTGEYDGPSSSSPQIASWVYDNSNDVSDVTDAIGQLTTETSYNDGNAYTLQQKGFNVFGESLGETISLPTAEGTLGTTYTTENLYSTTTGLLLRTAYPASPDGGSLPAENLTYGYETGFDLPAGLTGLAAYVQNITYTDQFQVEQEEVGSTTDNAYITNTYDPNTGALTNSQVANTGVSSTPYDNTSYTYDPSGNITSETDTREGTETETQCFTYDTLGRLTEAWTATDDCATDPSTNDGATVGDGITGSAYWTTWAYNPLGNRTSQTGHSLTGGTNTVATYGYGNPSGGQPDTLTSSTTKGPSGTSTASYSYDSDGNTLTRDLPSGDQTLTWTDDGKLATDTTSAGESSYIYDADGNLLLEKDPGKTTLYLFGGAEQIVLNTSSGTVTGTRFIALPGGGEAVRTGASSDFSFEFTDQHNTGVLTLNSSCESPAWRQYDPFGNPRGTAPSSWPDTNAFLGKPTDENTGLDIIGARDYDPALGRFISQDPVLEETSPQQMNGYTYAADNPVSDSDPTGLCASAPGRLCATGNPDPNRSIGGGGGTGSGDTGGGGCPSSEAGCPGYTSPDVVIPGSVAQAVETALTNMDFLQYLEGANPDPNTVQYDLWEALYRACAGPAGTCPSTELQGHLLPLETISGIMAEQAHAAVRQDETAGSGGVLGLLKALGETYLATMAAVSAGEGLLGLLPEASIAAEGADGAADDAEQFVYRIHGDQSGPWGHSWTPENPLEMDNARAELGLPKVNSGEFLTKASVQDMTGVTQRAALPLDGNPGGGPEWLFPDPQNQLSELWTIPIEPPF
jgi:RHS repeat-associated protein